MSLSKSIVVVNEYTIKQKSGGGSRGGTPGSYVTRYMARNGATEDLTPVRLHDQDQYITRYMARESATENASDIKQLPGEFQKAQGYGGVAFSNGDLSLSDAKLRAISKDIQNQFDAGKTVMKTVLSFDGEYLKHAGVVPPDFECKKRGDYRGNLDQMRLRMAIDKGIKRMSKVFSDLEYVGVIQVDTEHVHCHLAMVDKGKGRLAKDGTQRGKISREERQLLRRGIDNALFLDMPIKQLSSNISHDRRNAVCFTKQFAHSQMNRNGGPQFLLACLPDDKRMWRAKTNRKEMRKANALMREYVMTILEKPDSGYEETLRRIVRYGEARRKHDGLSMKESRKLVDAGKERLVQDCMNGVYAVLKSIPDKARKTNTPMLQAMSMDYTAMAEMRQQEGKPGDRMMEFMFHLRSYSSRLSHHRSEKRKYSAAAKEYERSVIVVADSRPIYDFFKIEAEYNEKCMNKYLHFLAFMPSSKEYEMILYKRRKKKERLDQMQKMQADKRLAGMTPSQADAYCRQKYAMTGGRLLVQAPQIIARRHAAAIADYGAYVSETDDYLADYGLICDDRGVKKQIKYAFDDVKALDLHHLSYDFPYNFQISKVNIDAFVDMANRRYDALVAANLYLELSGQSAAKSQFPQQDVKDMKALADRLSAEPVFKPILGGENLPRHRVRTMRLDADQYMHNMEQAVKHTLATSWSEGAGADYGLSSHELT